MLIVEQILAAEGIGDGQFVGLGESGDIR